MRKETIHFASGKNCVDSVVGATRRYPLAQLLNVGFAAVQSANLSLQNNRATGREVCQARVAHQHGCAQHSMGGEGHFNFGRCDSDQWKTHSN